MQSRLQLAGQVVHPLLFMCPLGLFALAAIFDVAGLLGAPEVVGTLGQCTVVAGLAAGTMAVSAAWFDAMLTRRPAAAARTGVLGALLDLGVLVLYAVIALLRLHHADQVADPGLVGLEVMALAAAVFGAWFGGRLGGRRQPKPSDQDEAARRARGQALLVGPVSSSAGGRIVDAGGGGGARRKAGRARPAADSGSGPAPRHG